MTSTPSNTTFHSKSSAKNKTTKIFMCNDAFVMLHSAKIADSMCNTGSRRDEVMKHIKTLKVRVKDKHAVELNRMARSVNFVWNFVNELSFRSIRERGVFLSAYDIQKYTNGAAKEL